MAGRKGQRSGGHNAKTTEQHIADGTFQKVRHGKRADNKPAIGKPEKPPELNEVESAVWDQMVTYLPDGTLGRVDSVALREMCRWYAVYCEAMQLLAADPINKDARLSATACWDRFWRIASDFGATPVARTRLQLDSGGKPKDENPIAALHKLLESRN